MGIHVYSFDRRGFGMSEGRQGEIGGSVLFDDHWGFIDKVIKDRSYSDDIPKFLFGISMGGLLAIALSL